MKFTDELEPIPSGLFQPGDMQIWLISLQGCLFKELSDCTPDTCWAKERLYYIGVHGPGPHVYALIQGVIRCARYLMW